MKVRYVRSVSSHSRTIGAGNMELETLISYSRRRLRVTQVLKSKVLALVFQ